MNIAVLRRPEQVEKIRIYPGSKDPAVVLVKYLNDEERKQVSALVDEFMAKGKDKESAARIAYGRVAVKGHEGIFDGDEVVEFTEANVDELMLTATDYRVVVLTAATTLQRAIEKN